VTRQWPCACLLVVAAFLGACEEQVVKAPRPNAAADKRAASPDAGAAAQAEARVPKVDFPEAEFAENQRSRDPFRAFARMFVDEARGGVKSQRDVVLDTYSIDELKLVGIVTRIHPPKAMLVDPTGKGHVIQRGQFIGRPEVVAVGSASGATYEVNWRVDRIREGDVVLIREDPSHPDLPSATRVIPLRPDGTIVAGE
jgi:type IV pilus assembly protein PilP